MGYKLVLGEKAAVKVKGVEIGGKKPIVIAGPCSVESKDQLMEVAWAVKEAGAHVLRGGAFKPRTSPYSFQGLGVEGLKMLREAGDATGLPVISEVLDPRDVKLVAEYVDILQVGARNCQNFPLLREVGKAGIPVLIKRGFSITLEEYLCAVEYILLEGNDKVILCERGIRTFSDSSRFTLDIAAIPRLKDTSRFPVIADPSHAAGRRDLVLPLAKAALAAGADGIMVEVHPRPDEALSDGSQSLTVEQFRELMSELRRWNLV